MADQHIYPFECKVFVRGAIVGALAFEQSGAVVFSYSDSYAGKSLAPSLPVTRKNHVSTGLHSFFAGFLSQGPGYDIHSATAEMVGHTNRVRVSPLGKGGILASLGARSIRGIKVVPIKPLPPDLQQQLDEAIEENKVNGTVIPGVLPKLFVHKVNGQYVPTNSESATHIAKFAYPRGIHHPLRKIVSPASISPEADAMGIVRNEYHTLRCANILDPDNRTVEAQLHTVSGFVDEALVVKRFDIDDAGNRYRVLDFTQLLDLMPEDLRTGSFSQITDFIRRHANRNPENHFQTELSDIDLFARRVLRGVLLGNLDMHLKNFSLKEGSDGIWRLTDDYDHVHTRVFRQKSTGMYMNVDVLPLKIDATDRRATKLNKFNGQQLCRLLDTFGIGKERQLAIVRDMVARVPAVRHYVTQNVVTGTFLRRNRKRSFGDSMLRNLDVRLNDAFLPAVELLTQQIAAESDSTQGAGRPARREPQYVPAAVLGGP